MQAVLRAKFTQHEDLRALLLSTGNARLVEWTNVDNPINRTWGEVNGKGQNKLGILLMKVRAELRNGFSAKRSGRGSKDPRPLGGDLYSRQPQCTIDCRWDLCGNQWSHF
jgi:hypothetical protein